MARILNTEERQQGKEGKKEATPKQEKKNQKTKIKRRKDEHQRNGSNNIKRRKDEDQSSNNMEDGIKRRKDEDQSDNNMEDGIKRRKDEDQSSNNMEDGIKRRKDEDHTTVSPGSKKGTSSSATNEPSSKKEKKDGQEGRYKYPCPVCHKGRRYLPQHMRVLHKWDEIKARSVLTDFHLKKRRSTKPETERKTKPRVYNVAYLCRYEDCHKEVVRLRQHCKQIHKLSGKILDRAVSMAAPRDRSMKEESSSDSSSDESEDEPSIMNVLDMDFGVSGSDSEDQDWMAKRYVGGARADEVSDGDDEGCNEDERVFGKGNEVLSEKNVDFNVEPGVVIAGADADAADGVDTVDDADDVVDDEEELEYEEEVEYEDLDCKPVVMCSRKVDRVFDDFVEWRSGINGGRKSLRSAKNQKQDCIRIMRKNGDGIPREDPDCLLDPEYLRKWIDFSCSDRRKPKKLEDSAIRTYLASVQTYHKFLLLTNKLNDLQRIKLDGLDLQINMWKKPLWKGSEKKRYENQMRDLENFPTPGEYKDIDDSPHSQAARSMIKKIVMGSGEPSMGSFCITRDYLLTLLISDNASRPGGVYNMTMGEYDRRTKYMSGAAVVSVKEHKTDHNGPVDISVASEKSKDLYQFVTYIRNSLEDIGVEEHDMVFTTFQGGAMSTSLVGCQFESFWFKCTGRRKMCPTLNRKFTETAVNQRTPEDAADFARHLNHSEEVAKKHYLIINKRDKAVGISSKIMKLQREVVEDEDDVIRDVLSTEITMGTVKTEHVRDKLTEFGEKIENFKNNAKGQKRILDKARKMAIQSKDATEKRRDTSQSNEDNPGNAEVDLKPDNSEIKAKNEDDQNEEKCYGRIRSDFSFHENILVKKHLSKYIKSKCSLSKEEIKSYVLSIPEMKTMVETRGISKLIVKIRTERSKID